MAEAVKRNPEHGDPDRAARRGVSQARLFKSEITRIFERDGTCPPPPTSNKPQVISTESHKPTTRVCRL